MLIPQNSNLSGRDNLFQGRQGGSSGNGGHSSMLLKPTGVPVFTPVDNTAHQFYNQTASNFSNFNNNDATESIDYESTTINPDRTVSAHSFVIGKKMQNQTEINLLEGEKADGTVERPFPLKVIYVKPTHHSTSTRKTTEKAQIDGPLENKENNSQKVNKTPNLLKTEFPKSNAIQNQSKLAEQKHRPHSATGQALQKDSIKHSKLGANSSIKPQVSYIKMVVSSQQRPQTAKLIPTENMKKKKQEADLAAELEAAQQASVDIPFAKNRFQGQFKEITKDLFKKAKEALNEEKNQALKLKQDIQLKKEKEKQVTEEVRKKNLEKIEKQKERGAEHVNFRKIEEEKREQMKNQENNEERMKRREARDKRKHEDRRQLGLDMFKDEEVKVYRQKVKTEMEHAAADEQPQIKQGPRVGLKVKRPQSEDLKGNKGAKALNADLPSMHSRPAGQTPNRFTILKKDIQVKEVKPELNEQEESKALIDKSQLLKEQKKKRKQQILEQQKQEQEIEEKKLAALKALEEKMKQQKEDFIKKKILKEKQKEEQERLRVEESKFQRKQQKQIKAKKNDGQKHKEQLNELRDWIDEQMQKEDLKTAQGEFSDDEEDIHDNESPEQISHTKISVMVDKKNNDIKEVQGHDELSDATKSKAFNQAKLVKHALPGNHILSEKEESKLGTRENRYGIFGDNGYAQVVEIQRNKLEGPAANSSQAQTQLNNEQTSSVLLSSDEKAKVKEFLQKKLQEVTKGYSLGQLQEISKSAKKKKEQEEEDKDQNEYPDIYKDEPMSNQNLQRKIISMDLDQPLSGGQKKGNQFERNNLSSQKQQNLNTQTKQKSDVPMSPPGVLNIERELKRQQMELQKEKEKATVVIQQWSRGFLARQKAHKLREAKRHQIEKEYGHFEDQVKFNSDYNLEKFLRDKQRLRDANKTNVLGESSSIMEKIGGADSYSFSISKSNRPHTGVPQSMKLPTQTSKNNQTYQQSQVQNYFREPSQKDPLSLIEIYARRNAHLLNPAVSSQRGNDPRQKSINQRSTTKKGIHGAKGGDINSSEIEEEIYSERFDDDGEISIRNRLNTNNDDIDEDIVDEVGSKDQSSSGAGPQINAKKIPFIYKPHLQSAQSESIIEEIYASNDRKSPNKRSPDRESYIGEDSNLQNQFSGRSKLSSSYKKSMIEEDIEGASNYEGEGFDSYSGSIQKPPPTSNKTKDPQFNKLVSDFEIKIKEDESKRKEKLSELLGEMKRYEQASISTVVVERMEKIMSETLAQKDKLLLGQRLHELEREKIHQQEINKIREEQIKLMSQLMLYQGSNSQGGNSMTDEERKIMMEGIQKIIDKPITIVDSPSRGKQQRHSLTSPKSTAQALKNKGKAIQQAKDEDSDYIQSYEEIEERDIIVESKSLAQYSIKESIDEADEDDSIVDEVDVAAPSESDQLSEADDEIKESLYVDGQKQDANKQKSVTQPKAEATLSKMRLALGSEETIRAQAKKTLQGQSNTAGRPAGQNNQSNLNEGAALNSARSQGGLFDNRSFEEYTEKKFKELIFDENVLNDFSKQVETAIDKKHSEEQKKLTKQLQKDIISPRTFNTRQKELERWVSRERKQFQSKAKKTMEQISEMGTYIQKMDTEKHQMIAKIGSPRYGKRFATDSSQSSIDHRLDDSEQIEESNESIRVRQAKYQLQNLTKDLSSQNKEEKMLKQKKKAAQKLLDEKERAIEQGIKDKLRGVEQEHVDNMLNAALNIDIQAEIEKRIQGARRAMEDSYNNQSEYDAMSHRRESEYDISQSGRSTIENERKKRRVNFASPDRYSSAHSYHESSGGASSRFKHSANKYDDQSAVSQSIDESIKAEEQSFASQSIGNKNSSSLNQINKKQESNDYIKESIKDSVKDSIKESIKESVAEEISEDDYSEDFQSQSHLSSRSQAASRKQQELSDKKEKQAAVAKAAESIEEQSDIEYSMNFDESIGASQQLGTSQPLSAKNSQQQQNQQQQKFEAVREQSENDEDDDRKSDTEVLEESAPPEEIDEVEELEEVQVEIDASESLQGSSKYQSSFGQNAADQSQADAQSEDKEIVQSTQSVDWQFNIEQPSHRSRKADDDQSEAQYTEDFEQNNTQRDAEIEENNNDMEDLDDLESFPDEIAESFDDYQNTVDQITDEFMALIMNEYKNDLTLGVEKQNIDETNFYTKWPFTLDQREEEALSKPMVMPSPVFKAPEIIVKKVSQEDQIKEKHSKDQASLKAQQAQQLHYLALIIDNINKNELTRSLEKPIEVDPLKILAKIQAFENDDSTLGGNSGLNESNQPQFILPLDYFMKIERLSKNDQVLASEVATEIHQNVANFHHKSIFDAFNEALDVERPYKHKGEPTPWSKHTRVAQTALSASQVDKVIQKAQARVVKWISTGAGTKYAPLPPAPPSNNDYESANNQPPIQPEDERRNALREERLGELLTKEIEENDHMWIDYENEDTQVKFDVADMVLEELAGEIAAFLNQKMMASQRY